MMFAAKLACQALRNSWIVNRHLPHAIFFRERNGIGPHSLLSRHGSDDARRIQSGAQKGAYRDVAHHLTVNSSAEPFANLIRKVGLRPLEAMFRGRKFKVPILFDFEFAALPHCIVSGRKLENSVKHRKGIWHPEKCQVLIERFHVHARFDSRDLKQSFYLRSESELSAAPGIIKRLNAKMIASYINLPRTP